MNQTRSDQKIRYKSRNLLRQWLSLMLIVQLILPSSTMAVRPPPPARTAASISVLAENRDPHAISAIVQALSDNNNRAAAIEALKKYGSAAIPATLAAAKNAGKDQRPLQKEAIAMLGRLGASSAIPELIPLVAADKQLESSVKGALLAMGAASVPALVTALDSKDKVVVNMAKDLLQQSSLPADTALQNAARSGNIVAIKLLGSRFRLKRADPNTWQETMRIFVSKMQSGNAEESKSARSELESLSRNSSKGNVAFTAQAALAGQLLKLENPRTPAAERRAALIAIENSGALDLARPILNGIANDRGSENTELRRSLVQALERRSNPDDMGLLTSMLSDSDAQIRNQSQSLITRLGGSAKDATLKKPLFDKYLNDLRSSQSNRADKVAAARALAEVAELDPLTVRQTLLENMKFEGPDFDTAAMDTLEKIGPEALIEASQSEYLSSDQVKDVLSRLSKMGPKASVVAPQIAALADQYNYLKKDILETLKAIGPSGEAAKGQVSNWLADGRENSQLAAEVMDLYERDWRSNPDYAQAVLTGMPETQIGDACGRIRLLNRYASTTDDRAQEQLVERYREVLNNNSSYSSNSLFAYQTQNCPQDVQQMLRNIPKIGYAAHTLIPDMARTLSNFDHNYDKGGSKLVLANVLEEILKQDPLITDDERMDLTNQLASQAASYGNGSAVRNGILRALNEMAPEDYMMSDWRYRNLTDRIIAEDSSDDNTGWKILAEKETERTLDFLVNYGIDKDPKRAASGLAAIDPAKALDMLAKSTQQYIPPDVKRMKNWLDTVTQIKRKSNVKLDRDTEALLNSQYEKNGKFLAINHELEKGSNCSQDNIFTDNLRQGAASTPLSQFNNCGEHYYDNNFGQIEKLSAELARIDEDRMAIQMASRLYNLTVMNLARTYWMEDFKWSQGDIENKLREMEGEDYKRMTAMFCPAGSCPEYLRKQLKTAAQDFIKERREVDQAVLDDNDPRKRWTFKEAAENLKSTFGSTATEAEMNRLSQLQSRQLAYYKEQLPADQVAAYEQAFATEDLSAVSSLLGDPPKGLTAIYQEEGVKGNYDKALAHYIDKTSSGPGLLAHMEVFSNDILPPPNKDDFNDGTPPRHALDKITIARIAEARQQSRKLMEDEMNTLAEIYKNPSAEERLVQLVGKNPIGTGEVLMSFNSDEIKQATDLACRYRAKYKESLEPGWLGKTLMFGGLFLSVVAGILTLPAGGVGGLAMAGLVLGIAGTTAGVAATVMQISHTRQISLQKYRRSFIDAMEANLRGTENAAQALNETRMAYDEYVDVMGSIKWEVAFLALDIASFGGAKAIRLAGKGINALEMASKLRAASRALRTLSAMAARGSGMAKAVEKLRELKAASALFKGVAGESRYARFIELLGHVADPQSYVKMIDDLHEAWKSGAWAQIKAAFNKVDEALRACRVSAA